MEDTTNKPRRAVELTMTDRKAAFAMLLMHCENGHIETDKFVSVAKVFGGSIKRLRTLWRDTLANMESLLSNHAKDSDIFVEIGTDDPFQAMTLLQEKQISLSLFPDSVYQSGKVGKCGTKRKFDRDDLKDRGCMIPYNRRNTYRDLGNELGISGTTAYRILKDEKVFWVSHNALNPHLTDVNKEWRFQFSADQIDERTVDLRTRSKPKFKDQFDEVLLMVLEVMATE